MSASNDKRAEVMSFAYHQPARQQCVHVWLPMDDTLPPYADLDTGAGSLGLLIHGQITNSIKNDL